MATPAVRGIIPVFGTAQRRGAPSQTRIARDRRRSRIVRHRRARLIKSLRNLSLIHIFALIYALAEGMLSASSSIVPALAQLAWIVVSLVAFIIVAPRIPRDE